MKTHHVSLSYVDFETPLGTLYIIFAGTLLAGISFDKPSHVPLKKSGTSTAFVKELRSYFEGSRKEFTQKVKFLGGTDFERKVWLCIRDVPFGETRTYKWVAERIGNPSATRAVGKALSRNPLPIVLPCHRIIESDGSIGGYSSGADKKRRLLDLEYYTKINRHRGETTAQ